MNKEKRITILKRFRNRNPYPRIGLNFSSSFELLISVLLSAKATDIEVNKSTSNLYSVANTPQAILALGIEELKNHIRNIGLFNKKAENIINTCRLLLKEHGGTVPENRKMLENLPGIGRKTANIILNTVFGWSTIAVDTHVFRVCNRTNFATGKNVKQVENKLIKVVPTEFKFNFHRWIILHGRYTCIARKPHCRFCIIRDLCEYREKFFL